VAGHRLTHRLAPVEGPSVGDGLGELGPLRAPAQHRLGALGRGDQARRVAGPPRLLRRRHRRAGGCCADLEGWRDWPDSWQGHPKPQIKRDADGLSIREDGESQNPVTLPPGSLPGLLAGVREDLIAFLGAVERWTADVCADAELAEAVVANIDRHVVITAPLEQP